MSNKSQHDDYVKRQELEKLGFDVHQKPAVHLDSIRETDRHAHCKLALAREIHSRGRRFDTEVSGPGGRVDVLDLGAPGDDVLVYEVETDVTDTRRREKADQYAGGPVRDVIVVDPTEAPITIHKLSEWANGVIVG